MIEKRVPKDIRSYKMKTFGNICTVRQLLFTVGAGGCVLAVYFLVLRPLGIRDYYVSFFVSMLCADAAPRVPGISIKYRKEWENASF